MKARRDSASMGFSPRAVLKLYLIINMYRLPLEIQEKIYLYAHPKLHEDIKNDIHKHKFNKKSYEKSYEKRYEISITAVNYEFLTV
jgi:hypothetical protein